MGLLCFVSLVSVDKDVEPRTSVKDSAMSYMHPVSKVLLFL